jgi:hypothetical protein
MAELVKKSEKRRAEETKKQYLDVVDRRIRRISNEHSVPIEAIPLGLLIADFLERSKEMQQASIRYHRSALSDWIRHHVSDEKEKESLLLKLKGTRRNLRGVDETSEPEKPTKGIRPGDWTKIKAHLAQLASGWPYTAAMLLEATLNTGLKPIGWKHARLVALFPKELGILITVPLEVGNNPDQPSAPFSQKSVPYLYMTKEKASIPPQKAELQIIQVSLEEAKAIRFILDHIRTSEANGKNFSVWQKEVQRGCRILMKQIFPRRTWHYTFSSAAYQFNQDLKKSRSNSKKKGLRAPNIETSLQASSRVLTFSWPDPAKKVEILEFLGKKPDWKG